MAASILEIKDGVAVGPLHYPVETGPGNLPYRLDDINPLSWTALCGVRGYVYRREGIVEFDPTLKDCFECRVAALKPKPEPTPDDLRRRARNAKRRQRRSVVPPAPAHCVECGREFTPSKYARRDARRFCSKPCSYIDYWRKRRQEATA